MRPETSKLKHGDAVWICQGISGPGRLEVTPPFQVTVLDVEADYVRLDGFPMVVPRACVYVNKFRAWRFYQKLLVDLIEGMQEKIADFERRHRDAETALDDLLADVPTDLWEDVSGFVDDVREWFCEPNPEFGGLRPLDMIGSADEGRLRRRIEAAKMGGW